MIIQAARFSTMPEMNSPAADSDLHMLHFPTMNQNPTQTITVANPNVLQLNTSLSSKNDGIIDEGSERDCDLKILLESGLDDSELVQTVTQAQQIILDALLLSSHDREVWDMYWIQYVSYHTNATPLTLISPEVEEKALASFTEEIPFKEFDSINEYQDSAIEQSPTQSFDSNISNIKYKGKLAFKEITTEELIMYECTVDGCDKQFTRRGDNAKAHWLMHNNMAPYECKICGLKFRRLHDLKRHTVSCVND